MILHFFTERVLYAFYHPHMSRKMTKTPVIYYFNSSVYELDEEDPFYGRSSSIDFPEYTSPFVALAAYPANLNRYRWDPDTAGFYWVDYHVTFIRLKESPCLTASGFISAHLVTIETQLVIVTDSKLNVRGVHDVVDIITTGVNRILFNKHVKKSMTIVFMGVKLDYAFCGALDRLGATGALASVVFVECNADNLNRSLSAQKLVSDGLQAKEVLVRWIADDQNPSIGSSCFYPNEIEAPVSSDKYRKEVKKIVIDCSSEDAYTVPKAENQIWEALDSVTLILPKRARQHDFSGFIKRVFSDSLNASITLAIKDTPVKLWQFKKKELDSYTQLGRLVGRWKKSKHVLVSSQKHNFAIYVKFLVQASIVTEMPMSFVNRAMSSRLENPWGHISIAGDLGASIAKAHRSRDAANLVYPRSCIGNVSSARVWYDLVINTWHWIPESPAHELQYVPAAFRWAFLSEINFSKSQVIADLFERRLRSEHLKETALCIQLVDILLDERRIPRDLLEYLLELVGITFEQEEKTAAGPKKRKLFDKLYDTNLEIIRPPMSNEEAIRVWTDKLIQKLTHQQHFEMILRNYEEAGLPMKRHMSIGTIPGKWFDVAEHNKALAIAKKKASENIEPVLSLDMASVSAEVAFHHPNQQDYTETMEAVEMATQRESRKRPR